jgi:hypothetical protein
VSRLGQRRPEGEPEDAGETETAKRFLHGSNLLEQGQENWMTQIQPWSMQWQVPESPSSSQLQATLEFSGQQGCRWRDVQVGMA